MKMILSTLAASLFVAGTATACPNLTGNYTCTYQDGSQEQMNLTQEEKNGVTVYMNSGNELIADNQTRQLPEDPSFQNATMRAWCDGEALKMNIIGKLFDQGQYFGDVNAEVSLSLDAKKSLEQVTSGTLKSVQGDFPLDGKTTCVRN